MDNEMEETPVEEAKESPEVESKEISSGTEVSPEFQDSAQKLIEGASTEELEYLCDMSQQAMKEKKQVEEPSGTEIPEEFSMEDMPK